MLAWNQCCGSASASFWCRSGSESDFPFWCRSRSGSRSRSDPTPCFTHVRKSENLFCLFFVYNNASLHCFTFLFSVTDFKIFNILDSILKGFLDKKVRYPILYLNIWLKQIRIRIVRPWMLIRVWIRAEMMPIRQDPDPKHWLKYRIISLFCKMGTVPPLYRYFWQYGASLRKSATQFSDVTRRCWSMLSGHSYYSTPVTFAVRYRTLYSLSHPVYRISHLVPSTRYLVSFCTTWHLSFYLFSHYTSTE